MGHIDLCPRLQCIDSMIDRTNWNELAEPHVPSHGLLRLPNVLHLGMEADTLYRARRGLNNARDLWTEEGNATKRSKSEAVGPREAITPLAEKKFGCCICWKRIVSPFWYCIDCEGVFLCAYSH